MMATDSHDSDLPEIKVEWPSVDRKVWDKGFFVNEQGATCRGKTDGSIGDVSWIADGYAVIDTILEHQNGNGLERYFVIKGKPLDEAEFSFTISARDAANGKLLRAELVNYFGVRDIGGLDLRTVQKLSKYVKTIRLISKPQWFNDQIMAPGLVEKIEFDFESEIVIDFNDVGNVEAGVDALEHLLKGFDSVNMTLLLAAFFGAPVIARLWSDDRFAMFVQGLTGSFKTEVVKLLMSVYGQRYSQEINIIRWGHGATSNAVEHLAAMTGPFPFIVDNYKNYTDKDPAKFQATLHAISEGGEKKRLTKDSRMQHSEEYQCLPIITGENYPGQDAASRARVIVVPWLKPSSTDDLTEAQRHIKDLNALGKVWCQWLSSDCGIDQMRQSAERFDAARSNYLKEVGDAINAGRIATNAAILALVWDLMYNFSPLTGLADKYSEVLKLAIEDHIIQSKAEVAEDLDAERFMDWLRAEISVGRYIVTNPPTPLRLHDHPTTIGHFTDFGQHFEGGDLLIETSVLRSILLQSWHKATMGARADLRSLLRQLVQCEYMQYDGKHQRFTHVRRLDGSYKRVYVFSWAKVVGEDTTRAPVAV
jgi:hypothetical protein